MYILIIIFGTYHSITSQQITFVDLAACKTAKSQLEADLKTHKNTGFTVECLSLITDKKK